MPAGGSVTCALTATTPSVVYPAAEQVVDFGAAQSAVTVAIYQLNAVVGRGYESNATI